MKTLMCDTKLLSPFSDSLAILGGPEYVGPLSRVD